MMPLYPTRPYPNLVRSVCSAAPWVMCRSLRLPYQQQPVHEVSGWGSNGSTRVCHVVQHNTTRTTQKFWISHCSTSPSTQVYYRMVCSQAGNNWASEPSIFNSCISKSIISPSQLCYKLVRYAQADQDGYTKIPKRHQLKYSIVLPLFIHGEKMSINLPGYSLKQFL